MKNVLNYSTRNYRFDSQIGGKVFFLFLFINLGVFSSASYGQVNGYIYKDLNYNGHRDSNEKGIKGVAVTNGREVVLSAENGRYQLPLNGSAVVSVIKPKGFALPLNESNLPLFYYIHRPGGSPKTKYKAVEPTGELADSVDFGLFPVEEEEDFSILVFGDPQPYNLKQVQYFEEGIINELLDTEGFKFGISLGDLVGNNLDLFRPYIDAIEKLDLPWYNVIGNHDLNFDVNRDQDSDDTYESYFGPANFAFNVGKVHFIVLDDILYPDPRDEKGYYGGFREDQLDFVENDLQFVPKDHLIVLAMHIPLSNPGEGDIFRLEDRDRLFKIIKDFPFTLSLSAHTHLQRQDFINSEEGWLGREPHHHFNVGTTSGDWYSGEINSDGIPVATMRDGTPKGYAILKFSGNKYVIDYKVAGKSKDYRMQIFAPKVVEKGKSTKAGIYANFFMGGVKDTVQYRIDGGPWMRMEHVKKHDPSFEKLIFRFDLAEELLPGRRPSDPTASSHLWRGGIPVDLEVGMHLIEVIVKDMYGRSFIQSESYRVEEYFNNNPAVKP